VTSQDDVEDALLPLFRRLVREGGVPVRDWPEGSDLNAYGLSVRSGRVVPPGRFEALSAERVRAEMGARAAAWLRRIDVHAAIDSTNEALMQRAAASVPIDGHVSLAEVQLQGRGRRGRGWHSPFGGSIALSLGVATARSASALGGASLVAGLAVLDAIERLGVSGVALKWPNDLLLGDAKLGGILIELAQARQGTQMVVGIGVNVVLGARVRGAVDRVVADLADFGPPSRNLLAGRIAGSVLEFLRTFDDAGFEPFRDAFCARHRYHGRTCRVLLGERAFSGRVVGVSASGGLLLDVGGDVEEFHGGEVSLREDAQHPG
jgi:BirA family transcriptional regulator, biotin operon repressor / biotin---[acetyl-CoA-carboxylase] ligase